MDRAQRRTNAGRRSLSQPDVDKTDFAQVVVIWIDWYAYHIARFRALSEHHALKGQVSGLELVGGVGVHAGLRFREQLAESLPVSTLMPEHSWKEAGQLRLARAVWKRLNEVNPQTVLVPGYYTLPAFAAALWSKLHGRRAVLMTETTEHDHSRVWWKEALKRFILKTFFDWAVAGGEAHARYLRMLGFRPDRIARFYDVVDNRFFRRECQTLRATSHPEKFNLPGVPYFVYVGRLAEEKNVDGLLTSYLQYRDRGGDWPLVLVGDGPLRVKLQSRAAKTRYAKDICFPGLKTSAELPPYYAFAGCFVLPSTREPWGLVVNEAMASGLPVIVSERCGCVEDLVRHGRNGFLFNPAQPDQLTASLTKIDRLPIAQLRAMGVTSQHLVAEYSPENWADEVARIAAGEAA